MCTCNSREAWMGVRCTLSVSWRQAPLQTGDCFAHFRRCKNQAPQHLFMTPPPLLVEICIPSSEDISLSFSGGLDPPQSIGCSAVREIFSKRLIPPFISSRVW